MTEEANVTNVLKKTIFLASYKGTLSGWKGLVNRGIRFFTKSIYSHSEICFGDPFASPVDCLTSTGLEGGVRIKRMMLNPAKWDLVALHNVSESDARNFFLENYGCPYDLTGTVRTVLPFVGREHPSRWFCSEVCAAVMGLSEPWRMHPGVLHSVAIHQNKNMGRAE
jgi:hypothetical protein